MKTKNLIILGSISTSLILTTAYVQGFGLNFGPFDLQFDNRPSYNDQGDYNQGYYQGQGGYQRDSNREAILDNPICRAIVQQKKLEFIVKAEEKINEKEKKITTKLVTVEPYAFGFTRDRQPVLRGTVLAEKLIKEITIKRGDVQLRNERDSRNDQNRDFRDDQNRDSRGDENRDSRDDQNRDFRDDQNQVNAQANESDHLKVQVKNKDEEHHKKSFSGIFRSHKSKENVESLNLTKVARIRVVEDSHFDIPKNLDTLFKDDIGQVVCQVRSGPNPNSDVKSTHGKTHYHDKTVSDQDRQLNAKIRDQLDSKGFSKDYVIKSKDGVVTISGTVDKKEDIQKINDQVKGIEGVKSVNNELTVKK